MSYYLGFGCSNDKMCKQHEGVGMREGVFMHIFWGQHGGCTECVPYQFIQLGKARTSSDLARSKTGRSKNLLNYFCHAMCESHKVKQKVSTIYSKHLCS